MFNKIKYIVKKKYNDRINIELIRKSNLFSKKYYLLENPEVNMDAAKHYYYYGYKENKSPSYDFSNDAYLKMYKDVNKSDINPLIHYLKYGKKENRKILKDNGYSISELYYKIYNTFYNYNLYNTDFNNKRINLFIENNSQLDIKLLDKIIAFCNNDKVTLRIIYNSFDISSLKKIFSKKTINTEYIYLNSNDYIFIGNEEYIISNGIKTAFALLNSNLEDRKIFLYLNDYKENLEDSFWIMNLCASGKVEFITDNNNLIDNINIYNLEYELKKQFHSRKIYYYNNSMFIAGVLMLNNLFLKGIYDSKNYTIHAVSNKMKYHFDTSVITYNIQKETMKNIDCLFYLTDGNVEPNVVVKMKKTNKKIDFTFLKSNNLSELKNSKYSLKESFIFDEFNNIMRKARNEE